MTTEAKTGIRFRTVIDTITDVPAKAKENGLSNRLAVIQDTYRPEKVDMYFDEALFLCLLDYAQQFAGADSVKVVDAIPARKGWSETALSLGEYRRQWSEVPTDEREPPLSILVEGDGDLILCIATEFWMLVGGPPEYADSYTYSLYSRRDLATEVREFLAASPDADRWELQSRA